MIKKMALVLTTEDKQQKYYNKESENMKMNLKYNKNKGVSAYYLPNPCPVKYYHVFLPSA